MHSTESKRYTFFDDKEIYYGLESEYFEWGEELVDQLG